MHIQLFFQLFGIAALPAVLSGVIYTLQKKGRLDKFKSGPKQIIIGIIFGLLACLGTAYGVDIDGAVANTRDAAIVCAGLLFGSPAGIIAGIIGGLYRWFAVYWGAGEFTRVACTIACILAGFYAAFLRKYMFESKMPSWILGFFVGCVMEVVHINLLFFTNFRDLHKTLGILDRITVPMVLANGIGVSLSILLITILSGQSIFYNAKQSKARISQTVQNWLLFTVLIALISSATFTSSLQAKIADVNTKQLIENNILDAKKDIRDASDENLLKITKKVASKISSANIENGEELSRVVSSFDVDEVSIIDTNGIIINSTNPDYIGFDMSQGQQSAEFLCLLDKEVSYVQEYTNITYNDNVSMKYAGVSLRSGGFVQVGYNSAHFYSDLRTRVNIAAKNRHIGTTGYIIITDDKYQFESHSNGFGLDAVKLSDRKAIFDGIFNNVPELEMVTGKILDNDVYCMYTITEGYKIIGVYPIDDAYFTRNVALYANGFIEIIIFAVLFALIYILIRVVVVNNILKINQSLAKITAGNLNTTVDVYSNQEFSLLSDDINNTVDTLKRYIAEAASRIDAELEYAKNIQLSALPHVEPNFTNKREYELEACMFTAKEVGGDFFDFYYIDDTHLAITIADVSGKGIPASLFMMTSKTMLRNITESGIPINEALTLANERLCEGNDANMFVTVWSAVIDLKTGHVTFANAGHNPPAIRKKNGSYSFLPGRPGLVLAAMDMMKYKLQEFDLEPGDTFYLYTDGVTEATNADEKLYGDDRLISALNNVYSDSASMSHICSGVKADVDNFVAEAPQFDDITMVSFKFLAYKE